MPWYGKYTRDAIYNPLDLWKKMFASDYVITLDEMPDLKTYTAISHSKSQQQKLLVFPTLFDEKITICTYAPDQMISIYNQQGICLSKVKTENNIKEVATIDFPAGMYLIKADGIDAVKIFKRK